MRIYTKREISDILAPVFAEYGIKRAVLFGSYSKETADENSDIDILVDSGLKGLGFVGFIEDVREALQREVDVIDFLHLDSDSALYNEIERTGTEIYAR